MGLKARRCRSLEQLGLNLPDPEFPDPSFPEHGAQFGGELRTVYGPSGQLGDHRKVRPKALRWLQGPRSAAIRPAVRATTPPTRAVRPSGLASAGLSIARDEPARPPPGIPS